MDLFVTGISGYLGTSLLRVLSEDSAVERIVGVDIRKPALKSDKLEFHLLDVRDPGLAQTMRGVDVALNLAFVLDEIRDKEKTYDININGSKNVFHGCIEAGVPWLIQVSSMAAFGAHPDSPPLLEESDYPRGSPDVYYCYSKAELEHYLCWLESENPGLGVTILRPCVVVGEALDNTVAWLFSSRFALSLRGHDPSTQFIHEDDLVSAIKLVLEAGARGVFHVTSDDTISLSVMMKRAGIFAPALPVKALEVLADIGFFLGFSPISSHWIRMFQYSMAGSNRKIREELGWKPSYTSSELFEEFILPRARKQAP